MIHEIEFKDLISQKKNSDIEAIEKAMLKEPQVPCSVKHSFGPGVYMREVYLPAGAAVMGHHQNFEHINVFIKGKLTMFEPDGTRTEMTAPMTFIGKPGRKIAYIHEDCIWMNVYSTSETDVEKLEAHYLTKSETAIQDKLERAKVPLLTNDADKNDYLNFLTEFGLTEERVRKISEDTSDLTALPYGVYKIKTGQSNIEGIGLFATADIKTAEVIAPARVNSKRTIAGRYTNHSCNSNAIMVSGEGSGIWLVATKPIKGCRGGQDGEEITVDYRHALKLTLEIGGIQCQR